MTIAEVAPAQRLPTHLPTLDYSVPPELDAQIKIGQLVKIPFRSKEIFGVVFNLKAKSETAAKLKTVSSLTFNTPLLTPPQLDFLDSVGQLYKTSLSFLIKDNLLPLQKRKLACLDLKKIKTPSFKRENQRPIADWYQNESERNHKLNSWLDSAGGQTLIIVPELPQIKEVRDLLSAGAQERAVSVSSELTTKELFNLWPKIRSGEITTVIGTRRAFFLPWNNLTTIIVEDEGNENHKNWDMAPRLQNRDAALLLAHSHRSRLIFLSHTPSVETYYFASHRLYQSEASLALTSRLPELVDLREERRAGNHGGFSRQLVDEISRLAGQGDIFLYLNRKGFATWVGCRDCGWVANCPQCQRPLIFYADSNLLRCHFCSYQRNNLLTCPNCRGSSLAMYGQGTQSAENSVRHLLNGQKIDILRLDADTPLPPALTDNDRPKVIIGTQRAWRLIDWSRLKLMCFLDIDTPLFVPEYKITENLWQILRDAGQRLPPNASFLVQTTHPDHSLFAGLRQPAKFYAQELAVRKDFRYPPYFYLLRLLCGKRSEQDAQKAAELAHRRLLALTKGQNQFIISDPLPLNPPFAKGQHWRVLIIKINYEKYKQTLRLINQTIGADWKVDPSPNTLLTIS